MPEEIKKSAGDIQVELDTSGPEVDVSLEETKEETVVDTAPETTEQETIIEEVKETEKKEDEPLEDYSKGVQSRIAKLTRKMREAERREAAAVEYAKSVEMKRKLDMSRFEKVSLEHATKLEENVTSALDSAQMRLSYSNRSTRCNSAQVLANKRIADP